jgi:hypothetical protein
MRLIGLAVILAVSLTLAPLAVEAQPSPKNVANRFPSSGRDLKGAVD